MADAVPASPPSGAVGLRRNYLNTLENAAQGLGALSPTGTLGVIIPLLIAKAGNGTWLVLLVTFFAFILMLLCVRAFAAREATAGSLGAYAHAGLGRAGGAVGSWAYALALIFGVASAAPAGAYYFDLVLTQTMGIPGTPLRQALLVTLIILLAGWAAARDVKLSTDLMMVIEVSSVLVASAIILIGLTQTHAWIDPAQLHLQGVHLNSLRLSLVLAFLTMAGIESVTTLGDEAEKATRTIPRVLMGSLLPFGLLLVLATYGLTSLSHHFSTALDQAAAPLDTIARSFRAPSLGLLSSLAVGISYFGCTLASLNAGARVVYSMARTREFPIAFARIHPVNRTPARSTFLIVAFGIACPAALLAGGVSLTSCIDYLSQISAFGYILAYFSVCLALPAFLYRRHALRPHHLAMAAGAVAVMGVVLVLSVYPVPVPPWRALPYIFLGFLGAGLGISAVTWAGSHRRDGKAASA